MLTLSMLMFEFSMNPIILSAIIALSIFIGLSIRRKHIIRIQKKLNRAESEMINSHAEILEMQKDYIDVEQQLRDLKDFIAQNLESQTRNSKLSV